MGHDLRGGSAAALDASGQKTEGARPQPPSVIRMVAGVLAGCALGFALGMGSWALLSLVQALIFVVWSPVESGFAPPLAVVLACAGGGAALAWLNGRFHSAPQPMAQVIAQTKENGCYDLDHPVAALGSFLMPLAFGAPLGPEAGLSGFLAAGGTAISRALHRVVFGRTGSDRRFGRGQAAVLAVSGVLGTLAGAKVWNIVSGREGIPRLPVVEFSVDALLWLVPLSVLGMSLSWVLRHSDSVACRVAARIPCSDGAKAALCGAAIAMVSMALPLVLYAGTEQLPALMENPAAHAPLELVMTSLVKICLLSLCLHFGWEGGPFFPLIFSAACCGVAVSQLTGVDAVLAVTVFSAALVGRFTRKVGLSLVVMALIVPVRGLIWAIVPLAAGAMLPTVDELWSSWRQSRLDVA